MNLLTNWINGNCKDVAEELLNRGPGAIAKFASHLDEPGEVNKLAKLLDIALEKRLDAQRSKHEPETPW